MKLMHSNSAEVALLPDSNQLEGKAVIRRCSHQSINNEKQQAAAQKFKHPSPKYRAIALTQ
jgi:hypothetical protein